MAAQGRQASGVAPAQSVDLSALGDALDEAGSEHPSAGAGAYKLDDTDGSPKTLSPSSPRSLSPVGNAPSTGAAAAAAAAAPTSTPTRRSSQPQPQSQHQPPTSAPATPTSRMDPQLRGKVKAIKGMFPEMDEETIAAVLAAEGGDEESGEYWEKVLRL